MIQLGKFVGGVGGWVGGGWLTLTTYIQLAGAGSKIARRTTGEKSFYFLLLNVVLPLTFIYYVTFNSL